METTKIVEALEAGKVITNPAGWKNKQKLGSAIATVASLALVGLNHYFPDTVVSAEDIVFWSGIIASLLGVGNLVVTNITSKKVGIGNKTLPDA